jgi:catechol 2,3-dioxygenase-like lactoylglutathione lyase family enzyme
VPDRPAFPGVVRQNGYVVRDLDAAVAEWVALGVGPFVTIAPMEQTVEFRGRTCTPTLTVAFANSGDLQIELIHQTGDDPSPYREFLDAGNEGFHHLAWWTGDFDAARAALIAAGHQIVLEGDGGGTARYLYVEAPGHAATMLEIMELNDMTRFLVDHVRTASLDWDGTDPVRPLF